MRQVIHDPQEPNIRLTMLHLASEAFRTSTLISRVGEAQEIGKAIVDIAAILEDYYTNGKPKGE